MYKYLSIFYRILVILLLAVIASCGAKNTANNTTSAANLLLNPVANNLGGFTPNNIIITKLDSSNKQAKLKSKIPATATITEINEKDKLKADKAEKAKQKIQDKAKTAKPVKEDGWFTAKQIKLLAKNFVGEKGAVISPLQSNTSIFLINTVPPTQTAFEYYKQILPNFKPIGFSIFNYGSSLKPEYIKVVARNRGANTVIVKRTYNADNDKYIYDVVYLNGDISSKDFYWMRNSKEAIPMNITLNNIAKQTNKPNEYSLEVILKTKTSQQKQQTGQIQPKQDANSATLINPINDYTANNSNNLIISDSASNTTTKAAEVTSKRSVQSSPLTDTEKMLQRVDNIIGLWMDSYDKSVVRIQEISADTVKKDNKEAYIGTKVKYYGAYIVFNNSQAARRYNNYRKINSDNSLAWHNNDLKFQFNSSGKGGIYLNYNKMPQTAIIRAFPVKGVIMVALANGETRYYIPLGMDVSSKFIKNLYKTLPAHIDGQDPSIGKNANYGSGMYGWIISTGAVLLTLGLISIF